jgi:hypothetical protein
MCLKKERKVAKGVMLRDKRVLRMGRGGKLVKVESESHQASAMAPVGSERAWSDQNSPGIPYRVGRRAGWFSYISRK